MGLKGYSYFLSPRFYRRELTLNGRGGRVISDETDDIRTELTEDLMGTNGIFCKFRYSVSPHRGGEEGLGTAACHPENSMYRRWVVVEFTPRNCGLPSEVIGALFDRSYGIKTREHYETIQGLSPRELREQFSDWFGEKG